MTDRPTWDETWLRVAETVSLRSACENSRVGVVIASADNRFTWVGYNGPPRGLMVSGPCSGWCARAKSGAGSGTADYSACPSIHAEINGLLRADASLIGGGTMHVTRAPCINCAGVIANSGLARVLCARNDEDDPARALDTFGYLNKCGIRAGYHGGPATGRLYL